MKHNQGLSTITIGILVMISIFLQLAPARADSGTPQLRTWLRENRVNARLVKLDRQDGFAYGLSFKGPELPLIVIAPDRQGGWLVQVDGEEALLLPDAAGSLQVIANTDEFWVWLCYFKALTNFLSTSLTCTAPLGLCYTDKLLALLINLKTCVPVEPSYRIHG